jgi:hypothetical protein
MPLAIASEEIQNTENVNSGAIPILPAFQPTAFVIYTAAKWTMKALEKAYQMMQPIGGHIEIVALQVVPYPLPLDRPPVRFEFMIRHLEKLVARIPEQINISTFLCREPLEALKQILPRGYCVVIGTKKRWWPTNEKRLAGKLRRAGYPAILVESE